MRSISTDYSQNLQQKVVGTVGQFLSTAWAAGVASVADEAAGLTSQAALLRRLVLTICNM